MTVHEKNVRRKMSLLQLSVELKNISKACKIMGYSRTQFYEIRRRYSMHGSAGLVDQPPGVKGRHPRRISEEMEKRIIDASLENPSYGAPRIAGLLKIQGQYVSKGTVYNFWCRMNLNTQVKRLLYLEKKYNESVYSLSEKQIKVLQSLRMDSKGKHVEALYAGALLNQDTFYFGCIKGVGKIYMQVVVDCFCSFAFAKLYTSKVPETACDILNSRALPFYEQLNSAVHAILTDNGTEYCGKSYKHPYELFLKIENIQHRRTKVRSPWTNGFVERMNRTILEEFLRVQGRMKTWLTLEDLQRDLDEYLYHYNFKRQHYGYRTNGQTPAEALLKGKRVLALPPVA